MDWYLSVQGFEMLAIIACLSMFDFFWDLRLLVLTVLVAISPLPQWFSNKLFILIKWD